MVHSCIFQESKSYVRRIQHFPCIFVHVCSIRGRTERHYIVEEIGEDVVLHERVKRVKGVKPLTLEALGRMLQEKEMHIKIGLDAKCLL